MPTIRPGMDEFRSSSRPTGQPGMDEFRSGSRGRRLDTTNTSSTHNTQHCLGTMELNTSKKTHS